MPRRGRRRRRRTVARNVQRNVQHKPYCPPNIVRYDSYNRSDYKTLWTCQICSRCMLSENAVRNHRRICKKSILINNAIDEFNSNVPNVQPPVPVVIDNGLSTYICDVCQTSFRRHAALVTHERVAHQHIVKKNTEAGPSQEPRMLVSPLIIKIKNIRANERLPTVTHPRTRLYIKKVPDTTNNQN